MTSFLFQYFSTISTREDNYIIVQDAMTYKFMQGTHLHAWTKLTLSYFVIFLIYIIQLVVCIIFHQVWTTDLYGTGTSDESH
jgi:hypothetical protein